MKEFKQWARQFCTVQEKQIEKFLKTVGSMSLYEMKRLFSEEYQNKISFSFILQQEFKLVKEVHLTKKYRVNNPYGTQTKRGWGLGNGYYGQSVVGAAQGEGIGIYYGGSKKSGNGSGWGLGWVVTMYGTGNQRAYGAVFIYGDTSVGTFEFSYGDFLHGNGNGEGDYLY